jgi:YbbR domain-containing protein
MRYHPFQHLGLKLLAVGLATLLWLTVAGEPVVERTLRVPLEFRNLPSQLEITGDPPSTVDIRVRGSSSVLSRLAPGDILAVLDLSGARVGSRLFHVRTDEVQTPFGIEVSQVVPSTVPLELEQSGSRSVRIVPAIEGMPAPGYVRGKISVEPATVDVIGPESRLKQLQSATTEPVSVDNASRSIVDVVTVGVPDSALRLREPRSATVSIEVLPAPSERTIVGVPVRVRNLAARLSAQVVPVTVRVTVRGVPEALNGLTAGSVQASVDLAGLGRGRYNLPVQIDPSSDFGVARVEPSAVDVRIQ